MSKSKTACRSISAIIAAVIAVSTALSPALAQDEALSRDLSVEQRPIHALSSDKTELSVRVWADRKNRTYAPGETATLYVTANRDAYITIVDVGTSGRAHVIFPNRHQPDNRVEAHRVIEIAGEEAPFRLRVGGPAGRELIKVFASEQPLDLARADLTDENGPFRTYRQSGEALSRDLSVELKRQRQPIATTATTLTILPKAARPTRGDAQPTTGTSSATGATGRDSNPDDLFQRAETVFYSEGGPGGASVFEALRWYTAAAEAGHVQAMYRIGRLHEDGRHLDRNAALALSWYRRAADRGSTQAMVRIGRMHAYGEGIARDTAEAIRWLERAAAQDDGIALQTLARLHDEGLGVAKNPEKAARYIISALKAGAWTAVDLAGRLSLETRRALQAELRTAGLYAGDVDGQIGAGTRAALGEVGRTG